MGLLVALEDAWSLGRACGGRPQLSQATPCPPDAGTLQDWEEVEGGLHSQCGRATGVTSRGPGARPQHSWGLLTRPGDQGDSDTRVPALVLGSPKKVGSSRAFGILRAPQEGRCGCDAQVAAWSPSFPWAPAGPGQARPQPPPSSRTPPDTRGPAAANAAPGPAPRPWPREERPVCSGLAGGRGGFLSSPKALV